MQSGNIPDAAVSYVIQCDNQPLNWWPFYRVAWCFNQLDNPDSALVFAETALSLYAGSERCLSELMKSLCSSPERVLQYSAYVRGGGVCRYRLARAEIELDLPLKASLEWLETSFSGGDDSLAADAGCWLSILSDEAGLGYIERSVALMPDETFYRSLLIEKLIDEGMLERARSEFGILKELNPGGFHFWQTASSVHGACGDVEGAIEASRRAYQLRMTPSTAADLGWKIYFQGRELMRNGRMSEALPVLYEASDLWSSESLWAVKSDSLINLVNEFTSTSDGYGEPI